MLFGVETPKIDMPFFITKANACKIANLKLFAGLLFKINLNFLSSFPKFQYA